MTLILEIQIENLKQENDALRERLETANRIIAEQVADAAYFIATYYVRKDEVRPWSRPSL